MRAAEAAGSRSRPRDNAPTSPSSRSTSTRLLLWRHGRAREIQRAARDGRFRVDELRVVLVAPAAVPADDVHAPLRDYLDKGVAALFWETDLSPLADFLKRSTAV